MKNSDKNTSVLAYGEILWDLLPDKTVLGGAPLNFANRYHEQGGSVLIASRLGSDSLGDRAYASIKTLGLDTALVQRDIGAATGTVPVTFDDHGVPDFTIIPDVAYDSIEIVSELIKAAETAACICYGTLVQRSAKSHAVLESLFELSPDSLKFLDINLRRDCYSAETVRSSLEHADILKLNEDEVTECAGLLGIESGSMTAVCETLLGKFSLDACLVTLGGDGVLALSRDDSWLYIPGWKIVIVDTVGSGDAFSAGFLYTYLHGGTFAESCDHGNRLGAAVAMTDGGTSPVSDRLLASLDKAAAGRNVRQEFTCFA